jgi:regulator of protease activity HflC (stomatin/prohibitin superfamily)
MFVAVFFPEVGTSVVILAVAISIYLLLTSVYVLEADEMLVSILFGEYRATYVSGTQTDAVITRNGRPTTLRTLGAQEGLAGFGIAILPWPFWHAVRFPTTLITLRIHARTIYTKTGRGSPSVPVTILITVNIRLAPNLASFVQTFNVLGKGSNLAGDCTVHDNLWKPEQTGEYKGAHEYPGHIITQMIQDAGADAIIEAIRTVGARYTWQSNKEDIRSHKKEFEDQVRKELGSEESPFNQAGLITKTGDLGPSAISFDVNMVDVTIEDAVAHAALGAPLAATLQAEATVIKSRGDAKAEINKREAQGKGIKKASQESNVAPQQILAAETVDRIEELKLFSAGAPILESLGTLLGGLASKSKPSGKKTRRPSKKPKP